MEAHPSPAEAAVEVALLNNKGLQAAFNELGIAEAVMIGRAFRQTRRFAIGGGDAHAHDRAGKRWD